MAAGYTSAVENCTFLLDSARLCIIQHSLCLCVHLNNRVGGWFCVLFRYGHKTESSEQLMGIGAGRNPWRVWDTQKQLLNISP